MDEPLWTCSGDSHFIEPPDLFEKNLAPDLAARLPRSEKVSDEEEIVHIDGKSFRRQLPKPPNPSTAKAMIEFTEAMAQGGEGQGNGSVRLQHLDEQGVWGEVVYPSLGLWYGQIHDPLLVAEAARVLNDFVHDELIRASPRFVPTATLPLQSVELSIGEAQRCAELGFHAVFLPTEPSTDQPYWNDDHWEPLWAACEAAELVIGVHIGTDAQGTSRRVVNLELTEDQEFFRVTTRRFLESESPLSTVRSLWDTVDGFDRAWWAKAAELGWTSLYVPEERGGGTLSGGATADAVIVAEEVGRMVAPGPFLPVNVVAAALADTGTDEQQADVFPGLLSGESIATWAFAELPGAWSAAGIGLTADIELGEVVLRGAKHYVEAANVADWFLVSARTGDGLTQVLVPAGTAGTTVHRGRSIDLTRRYGRIEFDSVRLPISAVVGEVGGAAPAIERQLEIALALQCAETVGAARRVFEFTLEYAQDRYAFGRPIASFQALKHRIADMLQWLEFAEAITDAAAHAVDRADPDAPRLVSVAKAYVGERALDIIDDCVQITGGIGVTWEHDIHLYSRRAALNRAVYGSPEHHKERVGTLLGV